MLIAKLKNKIHISLRLSEKFPPNEQKRPKNRRFFIFQVHFCLFVDFILLFLSKQSYLSYIDTH